MRQCYQTLVIPYLKKEQLYLFGVFHRTGGYWQFVSGGGEENETTEQTALRELFEETGILKDTIIKLETICSVPTNAFSKEQRKGWKDLFIIPEFSFAVEIECAQIVLSSEHDLVRFCDYDTAMNLLKYDSNKTALYELNEKLKKGVIK